jgi:hypothetical protein
VAGGAYGNGRTRHRVVEALLLEEVAGRRHLSYAIPDDPSADAASDYRWRIPFWLKVARGVDCIALLGAGRCLRCSAFLASDRARGTSARSARRMYCDGCKSHADVHADRDAMTEVFRQIAGTLGPPEVSLRAPDGHVIDGVQPEAVERLLAAGFQRA